MMPLSAAPNALAPLIRFEDVTVRVGACRLLPHTNWEIRPGENWALIGPNGAGKSTLAAALAGRRPVVAGRIRRHPPLARARDVTYVGSEQHLRLLTQEERHAAGDFAGRWDPGTTVAELLRPAKTDIRTLLGLEPILARPLRRLSSGEWRKVLLARALIGLPRLLVLDEPFDGVDSDTRHRLAAALARMMTRGLQLVIATQQPEDLPPGIFRAVYLADGRVVGAGPLDTAPPPPGPTRLRLPLATWPASSREPLPPVLVDFDRVTVRYGETVVLNALTWRMRRGEHWAVTGPNGAGKTTLLRLIAADHPQAYANRIHLFGRRRGRGETVGEIRARIGMVASETVVRHQRPLPVLAVVLSGLFDSVGLYRRPTAPQTALARRWLAAVDLEAAADTDFRHLSQGQQRLVLLARAAIKGPDLLILDEPCEGLDADHRQQVLALIDQVARHTPAHLLYVTHRPADLPACVGHRLALPPAAAAQTVPDRPGGPGPLAAPWRNPCSDPSPFSSPSSPCRPSAAPRP